jgi:hypothetical protein
LPVKSSRGSSHEELPNPPTPISGRREEVIMGRDRISRPRHVLARLGYPWVCRVQQRFGRESLAAMVGAVGLGSLGNLRTQTARAFDAAEMQKILGLLPK